MRYRDPVDPPGVGEPTAAPTRCPQCGSSEIKTTSKVVTSESYWRCEPCGEVWNAGRLQAGSRYIDQRPYRR